MKSIKQVISVSLVAVSAFLFTGCVAALVVGAAAGAGSVVYVKGELKTTEAISLDQAYQAAESGLKDLDLLAEAKEKDTLNGGMEAQGVGDKRIWIKLHNVSKDVTEMRIRVGVFGDQVYSQKIYDAIKVHFKDPLPEVK